MSTQHEKTTQHEEENLGFKEFSNQGEVTIHKGPVLIKRANGKEEPLELEKKVEVYAGDRIYWTHGCSYTQQGG